MPSQAARRKLEQRGESHDPAGCASGVCGSEAPPLVGSVLTSTGLTLAAAAERFARGDELPPMSEVQLRMVEAHAAGLR